MPVRARHQLGPLQRLARPKGRVIVRACLRPAGLRVEVEDEGGPWENRQERNDQRGRGLAIVNALATDWSVSGDGTSRTVWFGMGGNP